MNRLVTLGCGALVVVVAASRGLADTVTLKNGREVHGRLVHEGRDVIRMRVPGGTITIPKREVATFAEDEDWGDDYARLTPVEDVPAETGPPTPSPPRPGPDVRVTLKPWTWAPGLSAERIAELAPRRDRLLAELRTLGPTPVERLRATEATAEERARIDELIQLFAARRAHVRRRQGEAGATPQQRVGSMNLRRENRRDEVADFGARAIGSLVEALGSDSLWRKRLAAQALGRIAGGMEGLTPEDARWLLFHADAPKGLIALLAVQGETDAPFVRQDADAALEAVTGHAVPFVPSVEPTPTPAEVEAAEAWQRWWTAERARWSAEVEANERRRAELLQRLAAVREGRTPDAGS